jgi:hypothetical protein
MPYTEPAIDYAAYPSLRQVLTPDLAIAPSAAIRERMEARFGEGAAEAFDSHVESIWGDIDRFAAQAAPVVAQVGGGALRGAMAGSSLGLPGIIAGAAAGGTGAALSHYGGGTARQIGGALTGITGLAGQFSPMGQVISAAGPAISGLTGGGSAGAIGTTSSLLTNLLGASGGAGAGGIGQVLGGLLQSPATAQAITGLFGGSSAAGQLGSFLQRPETQQAFAALQLGELGRSTVPVGAARTPVPTAAFPQVLSHLADQVAAEAAGWSSDTESALDYMQNPEGDYVGDPVLDRDRSARVWNLLNEAQAERVLAQMADGARAPRPPRRSAAAEALDADTELYDAMDEIELAALEGDEDSEWEPEFDDADA